MFKTKQKTFGTGDLSEKTPPITQRVCHHFTTYQSFPSCVNSLHNPQSLPKNFKKMGKEDNQGEEYLFKIVLIGDSAVGKSNLLSRFSRDEFDTNSKATIGVEFQTQLVEIEGKEVKAQIWDTAAHCDTAVAQMLVGNKCDLEDIRAVSVEEGKALAEEEGLFFMETSALDATNVDKAFEIVIREIFSNVSRKLLNSDAYKAQLSVNRVSLVNNGDGAQSSSCCSR
ncbi:hypothetical protein YC2023_006399 [Brassica napus]